MTLSLEEVRNIRFPMVHKPNEDGYRASAVDNFMDKLEISYAQLVEEIDHLRSQASHGGESSAEVPQLRRDLESARSEISSLRGQLESARSASAGVGDNAHRLNADNQRLHAEVESLRAQLNEARSGSGQSAAGLNQLRGENDKLRAESDDLRAKLSAAEKRAAEAEAETRRLRTSSKISDTDADKKTRSVGVIDSTGVQRIEVRTSAEASPAVVRLVELATAQAETLLSDADIEARRRVDEAVGQSERVTADAAARAAQSDQETKQRAERMLQEARLRADRLDAEVRERRKELFEALEMDRDRLADRVNQLRDYEENYRRTFTGYLESQIEQLKTAEVGSGGKPNLDAMYGMGETSVSTPRLDALVAESRADLV